MSVCFAYCAAQLLRVCFQSCLIPFKLQPKPSSSSPSITAFSSSPSAPFLSNSSAIHTGTPGLDAFLRLSRPEARSSFSQSCGFCLSNICQLCRFPLPLFWFILSLALFCKSSFYSTCSGSNKTKRDPCSSLLSGDAPLWCDNNNS